MLQPQPDEGTGNKIIPPTNDATEPDRYSSKGPAFINDGAPHQVFRFCRWGIEYGTDDKGHAASIILSVTLLGLLLVLFLIGAFVDRPWIMDAIKIMGTAFTFTAGVAIGKGSSGSNKNEDL